MISLVHHLRYRVRPRTCAVRQNQSLSLLENFEFILAPDEHRSSQYAEDTLHRVVGRHIYIFLKDWPSSPLVLRCFFDFLYTDGGGWYFSKDWILHLGTLPLNRAALSLVWKESISGCFKSLKVVIYQWPRREASMIGRLASRYLSICLFALPDEFEDLFFFSRTPVF